MSELTAKTPFFSRHYFLIMLLVAGCLPLVGLGAWQAMLSNKNDVRDWLPPSYKESKELAWFVRHFSSEPFVVVSWDGCTLGNDERLTLMAELLVPSDPAARSTSHTRYFKEVMTGAGVLEQLTSEPLNLDYDEVLRRLEGSLIGPAPEGGSDDERATCLLVTLSDEGRRNNLNMRRAIEAIEQIARQQCRIPPAALYVGGPPVDNVAIDIEGQRTLYRLAAVSALIGFGLAYLCFRNFRYTHMVFMVGVLSATVSMAIVSWWGAIEVRVFGLAAPHLGAADAVLMPMPALVYVLGLSAAVHIVNYYRDARAESGIEGAPEKALRHGWKPCVLAAMTTAVGLAALYTSDITPIRKFGMFSAIGVLATLVLLFTTLPANLHRFAPKWGDDPVDKGRNDRHAHPSLIQRGLMHFGRWVVRHSRAVTVGCTVLMILCAFGLAHIETRVQLLKLFDEDAKIIRDYAWLEQHVGNLVPMEVVLRIDHSQCRQGSEDAESDGKRYRLNMRERMQLVRHIQQRIEALPDVGRALTAATFGPSTDAQRNVLGVDVVNRQLERFRERLLAEDYLRDQSQPDATEPDGTGRPREAQELWRISARVSALNDVDYGQFVKEIRDMVEPVLAGYEQRDQIVAAMHEDGKRLRLHRVAVVYDAKEDTAKPQYIQSLGLLFELLREAGARVTHNVNMARIPRDDSRNRTLARWEKELAEVDCVVVATPPDRSVPTGLLRNAPLVVDLSAEETAEAHDGSSPWPQTAGISAVYTGFVPLVYKTQRQLLVSLQESLAWACGLIALVMIVVFRSVRAGLLTMIPNVFPIVLVFGTMGWMGVKIDIGIMMTASVALGVAVDDTVHFLTWFRRGIQQGLDRKAATLMAYKRCGTAMIQTTIIGGLGLSVFAVSSFTPTQQFGLLMLTLLSAAILGDLIYLPALLAGPVGRFFSNVAPPSEGVPAMVETSAPHAEDRQPAVPSAESPRDAPQGPKPPDGFPALP